jgi:hypothetical protein
MNSCCLPTHDVIPAKAGIHLEIAERPQGGAVKSRDLAASEYISGWIPAFAGMTSDGPLGEPTP